MPFKIFTKTHKNECFIKDILKIIAIYVTLMYTYKLAT